MAQNTFRKNTLKEKPANTLAAPEETENSVEKEANQTSKFAFFKDPRLHLVIGVILIFSSIFISFALISYPFTGNEDQSMVESLFETNLRESGQEAENWLGLAGAVVSYFLIFKGFGIASLLFMPLLFVVGVRIVFKKTLYPPRKLMGYIMFLVFWISVTFGYIVLVANQESFLGFLSGGIGYEFALIFNEILGIGTLLLIVLLMIVFLIFTLNITSFAPKQKSIALDNPFAEEDDLADNQFNNENENELEQQNIDDDDENIDDDDIEIVEIKKPSTLPLVPKQAPVATPEPEKDYVKEYEGMEIVIENKENLVVSMPDLPPTIPPIIPTPVIQNNSTENSNNITTQNQHIDDKIPPVVKFEDLPPYDPTLDLSTYKYPTIDLLKDYGPQPGSIVTKEELIENRNKIINTLKDFGIEVTQFKATIGPTVTLYEIVPEAGIKISKISNLSDDIALRLSALGVRIIAPMPGKGTIGMEVPNKTKQMVPALEVLRDPKFANNTMELPIAFGKTISNEVFVADLATMPHLLMAGATGMGKSVGINMLLTSLLYKKHPSQLKIVMVDPKKVELSVYSKIERHFLAKLPEAEDAIITDTKKVVHTLNSLCIEMDTRYSLLKDAGCRNIKEYNPKFVARKLNPNEGHRYLPYIVVVIDELADLMMTAGKEVEQPIARIAQLARAVGIHLVLATQRPSVNVITGVIKANFPARLSFRVTSTIDSRTILDEGGANQLIGKGDMLLKINSETVRLQCAFIDTPEVENVVDFIGVQKAYPTAYHLPEYFDENADPSERDVDLSNKDPKFNEAAKLIVTFQQGSTSLIQRKLSLGYARSGRIMDQLEAAGIVGPPNGSKVRDVLIKDDVSLQALLAEIGT